MPVRPLIAARTPAARTPAIPTPAILTLAVIACTLAPPAAAAPGASDARWCTAHNPGLGNIQWDCRYPTLALCAATVGLRSDMCLENPSWPPRAKRRR